ncbi:MAG: hypothetical protein R2880_15070 [Deinococcales bacterium]
MLNWKNLLDLTQGIFPIRSIIKVHISETAPIIAPSYWLFPETTTEASQIEGALAAYGLTEKR